MALVSYVDILEVVGELQDFRNKLIEGETIANRSGIIEAKTVRYNESGWEVLAKCQAQVEDLSNNPLSVCICCTTKPRNLKCLCSCNHKVLGKCKHVIATLIYLNRNNVSTAASEVKVTSTELAEPPRKRSGLRVRRDLHYANPVEIIIPRTRQALRLQKSKQDDECVIPENNYGNTTAGGRGPDFFPSVKKSIGKTKSKVNLSSEHGKNVCKAGSVSEALPSEDDQPLCVRQKLSRAKQNALSKQTRKLGVPCPTRGVQSQGEEILVESSPSILTTETLLPGDISEGSAKSFSCKTCGKSFGKKSILALHLRQHCVCKAQSCLICAEKDTANNVARKLAEKREAKKVIPKEKHVCEECGEKFQRKRTLDSHKKRHLNASAERQFSCEVCSQTFPKKNQLTEHKRTHSKEELPQYQCTKCGKCYLSKRSFQAHGNCDEKSKPVPAETVKRKKTVVSCEVCGKAFSNRMHHEEHMRSHTGERPFQCVECGKGFASKRSLKNHSHDGPDAKDRPYLCSQCPGRFATAFMLKTHSRTHTDEKPWVCSECGKGYRSQHVLIDHQNQHKGIKAHSCKECGKKFTWRTSLWAHSREHARDKPFECVQCGAIFAEQLELKEHWVEHSDKPYQCSECGIGFLLEEDRDKHMETHKKEATHTCRVCNEAFTRADMLLQHCQTFHKEAKTSLCPHCGKTFGNRGHLKVHMMIHSGEKPFECETCHKRFYTRSLMRKHAIFHSSERPFECTMCGDRFPTASILNNHTRIHTGERPYTCKACGKSFSQSTYLRRHSMTHTGERPYPCTECDSAFMSRYDLKIHMRVHTGEKPFACVVCSERFYERSALNVHKRVHTGEQPFICDVCDKGFNTRTHLRKHYTRVHPDVLPLVCEVCNERFSLCEELRKHRRSVHVQGSFAEKVAPPKVASPIVNKDPLESLIEDSEILQDDPPVPDSDMGFQVPNECSVVNEVIPQEVLPEVPSEIPSEVLPVVLPEVPPEVLPEVSPEDLPLVPPVVPQVVHHIVPDNALSLSPNLEAVSSIQDYDAPNGEFTQILRTTLLR